MKSSDTTARGIVLNTTAQQKQKKNLRLLMFKAGLFKYFYQFVVPSVNMGGEDASNICISVG